MFNQKAAFPKNKPDEIMQALDIRPGQKAADIGSGGGYFSLRFAEAVGKNGEVFSVDMKEEYLNFIRSSASKKGLHNIKTFLISERGPDLPDHYFDLIFFRNVYHHLENRIELMRGYKSKLKPDGRVAIIEYGPGGSLSSFLRLFGHNVPKEKIISEMEQAGFKKVEEHAFLPEQSFTVYKNKS